MQITSELQDRVDAVRVERVWFDPLLNDASLYSARASARLIRSFALKLLSWLMEKLPSSSSCLLMRLSWQETLDLLSLGVDFRCLGAGGLALHCVRVSSLELLCLWVEGSVNDESFDRWRNVRQEVS